MSESDTSGNIKDVWGEVFVHYKVNGVRKVMRIGMEEWAFSISKYQRDNADDMMEKWATVYESGQTGYPYVVQDVMVDEQHS